MAFDTTAAAVSYRTTLNSYKDKIGNIQNRLNSKFVLEKKEVLINLKNIEGRGRILDFSLVSMLARYDVKKLKYVDQFPGEIAALAIWNEFKSNEYLNEIRDYQKIIIQNEMED